MKTKTATKKRTKKVKHDFGKFLFEGKKLGKGRLVLAVIKKLTEKNPKLTVSELNKQLSRTTVHSSFDVVAPVSKAPKGRYFLQEDAMIKLGNKKVAVTNQWGSGNINHFINTVSKMGFRIRKATA